MLGCEFRVFPIWDSIVINAVQNLKEEEGDEED